LGLEDNTFLDFYCGSSRASRFFSVLLKRPDDGHSRCSMGFCHRARRRGYRFLFGLTGGSDRWNLAGLLGNFRRKRKWVAIFMPEESQVATKEAFCG